MTAPRHIVPGAPAGGVREAPGPDVVGPLVLDLLEWVGPHGRPYPEVMDAWRTSCPRLPVWEEANERGYVRCDRPPGGDPVVRVTAAGAAHLARARPPSGA